MIIEYFGELLPDGHLSVDPAVLAKIKKGEKFKITIESLKTNFLVDSTAKKELDSATRRLLERMRNGKPLGAPENPEQLSHSRLMSERLEEKFHWKE